MLAKFFLYWAIATSGLTVLAVAVLAVSRYLFPKWNPEIYV